MQTEVKNRPYFAAQAIITLLLNSSILSSYDKYRDDFQVMNIPPVIPPVSLQQGKLEMHGSNIVIVERTIGKNTKVCLWGMLASVRTSCDDHPFGGGSTVYIPICSRPHHLFFQLLLLVDISEPTWRKAVQTFAGSRKPSEYNSLCMEVTTLAKNLRAIACEQLSLYMSVAYSVFSHMICDVVISTNIETFFCPT